MPVGNLFFDGPLARLLTGFAGDIAAVRVLDPACGSGNFLYVALKRLLDLEKEIVTFATRNGLSGFFPLVDPEQLHGIEVNAYAHELAQVVVWIGYIQWLRDNGFGVPSSPILKPLHNIQQRDAVLAHEQGRPVQPSWPQADVIIGNPPFLGTKKMRFELGDEYVETLRSLYAGQVVGFADLVCYWFERRRAEIEAGRTRRAGLLATQGIRGGLNRLVLDRIKETGDVFMAWRDRPWILDGAAVHVSIVGFDDGTEKSRMLDGQPVPWINADLTASRDLTHARRLAENREIAFVGDVKSGAFDISPELAEAFLSAPPNPNGRTNRDVLRPWVNGLDITRRLRGIWIIDFGVNTPESDAMLYEGPYEHVLRRVKPERDHVKRRAYRDRAIAF